MAWSTSGVFRQEVRPSGVLFFLTKVRCIASNTFVEAVRQPVYFVIVGGAVGLILISPYLTMFTLMESPKFMRDMGLATMMLAGLLLAAFTASSVINDEIENKTVLTVIAKPVGRMEFILGKFLGVMAGLVVAGYLMSLTLSLTMAGGAMEADIEQEISPGVVLPLIGCVVLAVGYGVYCNFFYDRAFTSRSLAALVPLFTLCFAIFIHWDPRAVEGKPAWGWLRSFDHEVVGASVMVMLSVLVMAALAVAISTRLTAVVNIVICSGVFIAGLLSDFLFRKTAEEPLRLGEGMVGLCVVTAAILLGVAAFIVLRRYVSRWLNVPVSLGCLGIGVLLGLIPVSLPRNVLGMMVGGSLGVLLLTTLVLYLRESPRVRGLLRVCANLGLFEIGAYGTPLLARFFGQLDLSGAKNVLAKVMYHGLPNLQVFWIADLLTAGRMVSPAYIVVSAWYALMHVMAYLFLAVLLFQERELA